MNKITRFAALYVIGLVGFARTIFACPVCFGEKDSSMQAGMNDAILLMLVLTVLMLSLIAAIFWYFSKRAKRHNQILSAQTYIDERGSLQMNNEHGVKEWNTF